MATGPEAICLRAGDLHVGRRASFEHDVTETDIQAYARVSRDFNPLHVDVDYARTTNHGRNIAHGAYQVGLASALVGMHLPGKLALVTSYQARFPEPLHFPSRVAVEGEIGAWNADALAGRLRVEIRELTTGRRTAEIQCGFTLHDEVTAAPETAPAGHEDAGEDPDGLVVITGASGGIGSELAARLAGSRKVLALRATQPLPTTLAAHPDVEELAIDLDSTRWPEELRDALAGRQPFATIHCAWPGALRGGLLDAPAGALKRQLEFGTSHLIELARLHVQAHSPGRVIAIGSLAGRHSPQASLAGYTLGKSVLEDTVRLLAVELAAKQVTVNAVCPGFLPLGINRAATERARKIEAARVPMGRLCDVEDIYETVAWLLSPAAAFVSGQVVGLTGGAL